MQSILEQEGSNALIFGINEVGYEHANESFTEERSIPWLQDVETANVWDSWGVIYRDVWILDTDNALLERYNLTLHDLREDVFFEDLKSILLDASL